MSLRVEVEKTTDGQIVTETDPKTGCVSVRFEPNTPDPTVEALAVIAAVRDPNSPDPSVADRLAAIECLLVPPEA